MWDKHALDGVEGGRGSGLQGHTLGLGEGPICGYLWQKEVDRESKARGREGKGRAGKGPTLGMALFSLPKAHPLGDREGPGFVKGAATNSDRSKLFIMNVFIDI